MSKHSMNVKNLTKNTGTLQSNKAIYIIYIVLTYWIYFTEHQVIKAAGFFKFKIL